MKMIKLKLFELSHFAIDYVFICVEEVGKEKEAQYKKRRQRGDDPLCDVAL